MSLGGDATLVNVRITHKKAPVSLMETVTFEDIKGALTELHSMNNIEECVLLQTCNRIECYVVSKKEGGFQKISEYLIKRSRTNSKELTKAIELSLNQEAMEHLLRVASGLESMVVGEDQILGQVWDAYLTAESVKTAGPVLKTVFSRAVKVGKRVRNETNINRGVVSIGSVAVELAELLLGDLCGTQILVVGAGEMGTLVAKALARHDLDAVFIANRTYERALKLAEELSGKAVRFDRLEEVLIKADVVICSTSAPHYILTGERVRKVMYRREGGNGLMIIDISNPRNVEESVQDIEGVELYSIDDLRIIAERNEKEREGKAEEATKIVEEALPLLERDLKVQSISNIVSYLFSKAEEKRKRELRKALDIMGNIGEENKRVIEDLTFKIIQETLVPIVENLRKEAENNNEQMIKNAIKLFSLESN